MSLGGRSTLVAFPDNHGHSFLTLHENSQVVVGSSVESESTPVSFCAVNYMDLFCLLSQSVTQVGMTCFTALLSQLNYADLACRHI